MKKLLAIMTICCGLIHAAGGDLDNIADKCQVTFQAFNENKHNNIHDVMVCAYMVETYNIATKMARKEENELDFIHFKVGMRFLCSLNNLDMIDLNNLPPKTVELFVEYSKYTSKDVKILAKKYTDIILKNVKDGCKELISELYYSK